MKKTFLLMIVLIASIILTPKIYAADDITGITLEQEMRAMIERGIIKGYAPNSYRPKVQVTREQFAAFLIRSMGLPKEVPNYTDVVNTSSLAGEIGAVQKFGLMYGSEQPKFFPTKVITREEMAIAIKRALDYEKIAVTINPTKFADESKFVIAGGIEAGVTLNSAKIMLGGTVIAGENAISFQPEGISTRDQVAAVLNRYLNVKAASDAETEQPPTGTTDPLKYYTATFLNGQLQKDTIAYDTFDQALASYNANSSKVAVYLGEEILKAKGSIAFANNKNANGVKEVTEIFQDTSFTKRLTYVEPGREMTYVESTESYVKVRVGGTEGFVKHSQIQLVPSDFNLEKDYYRVSSGGSLVHYIHYYSETAGVFKNTLTSYIVGPAHAAMRQDVSYMSNDGVHFYNGASKLTYVPYFQFLSARSTTNYTAEELDAYIASKVSSLEIQKGYSSKMRGLGAHLKFLEAEKRVNALMILSLAAHESAWGMSTKAQKCNNLFGLYAYDSLTQTCNSQGTFVTPADSATHLVESFWNASYINPDAMTFRNVGAAFGNKTTGFNVNYASDPTWGAKAANHMYNTDKELGGKDYVAYKKMAFTKLNATTNVRTTPTTASSDNILYAYKPKYLGYEQSGIPLGYPVTIVGEVMGADGYIWYEVLSDKFIDASSPRTAFIRSDVVTVYSYQ